MQRNHLPTVLGQVLDEIETDKARAARDEGGFVSHGLRPVDSHRQFDSLITLPGGRCHGPERPASHVFLTDPHPWPWIVWPRVPALLPLDGAGGLGGDVVDHARLSCTSFDDAPRGIAEDAMSKSRARSLPRCGTHPGFAANPHP